MKAFQIFIQLQILQCTLVNMYLLKANYICFPKKNKESLHGWFFEIDGWMDEIVSTPSSSKFNFEHKEL